tara:strand:+ start:923 stop:2149 length:1227 start_codon:yes stop_codon:yes gene_type:complete
MILEIVAILFLLLLSAYFSSSETAITRISDAKILQWDNKYKKAKKLLESREKVISTLLLGNNIVNILASVLATSVMIKLFGDKGIIYTTILMTTLIFIFSEILPKTYAIRKAEVLILNTAPVTIFFNYILSPVSITVHKLVRLSLSLFTREDSKNDWKQNLRGAILLANNQGEFRKRERIMLENILDLSEVKVSEIMTHRKDIKSINIEEDIDKIINIALNGRFTRLPMWKENPDNIVGTIHIKDLLRATNIYGKTQIIELIQKPLFISENTSLSDQLNQFKNTTIQMAFVIDEYGDLQGLITLEDVLEEIVGEIFDEFDKPTSGPEILSDESVNVDGNMTIRDLNRFMDWKLPDEEASTVAGLVIDEAQKLPKVREIIQINKFRFTILGRQRTRITKLNIRNLEKNK